MQDSQNSRTSSAFCALPGGGELTADELSDMLVEAAAEGCCNNAQWRGRLCSYHQGYQSGVDAALESYAKLLAPALTDGKVCGG